MKPITPCIWFDKEAEQAAKFYTSIFPKSKVLKTVLYGEAGPLPKGTVQTVSLKLNGQKYLLLNGGSAPKSSPAISFIVPCKTQKEVDYYWKKLLAGGSEMQCGWLTDKYGVSWQITPSVLMKLMASKDAKKVARVTQAMMKMVKLDIKELKAAAKRPEKKAKK